MTILSKAEIEKICRKMIKEYPVYKGAAVRTGPSAGGNTVIILEKKEKTGDGHSIKLTMRITVDEKGNILQVSGSR